jgi:hypothetical protein
MAAHLMKDVRYKTLFKLYTIMGVSEGCATRIYLPRKDRLVFQFCASSS